MSRTKRTMKKMVAVALSLVFLLTILAGCMGQQSSNDDQKRILRIASMYGDRNYTEQHLRSQYTDIFQFANRNIQIEFDYAIDYGANRYRQHNPDEEQPDPIEEMKKLMEGPNPPDIVLIGMHELSTLVEENLLAPLEPLMAKDNFDISDFVPSVVDGLKSLGNDQLYALAPTFYSQALVYNKGIFNERGVAFPEDGMYWDEVFDMATLLTSGEGEDRKAGFAFSSHYYGGDLYYEMRNYIAQLELSMFSEDRESMLVDSQSWEDTWQTMYNLHQSNVLPEQPDYNNFNGGFYSESTGMSSYNPFQHDAFLSGKVAMTIVDYNRINEIINANREADLIEGFDYIDWDVVTMPVHPQNPEIGGMVYMDPIVGINAKAQNSEDAWNFLKFMNGEDWAELKSMSTHNMMSRKEYIKPRDGIQFNIEAFYTLRGATINTDYLHFTGRSQEAIWRIESIGQQKFSQVISGDLGVREALKEWQTEGDALLQQIRDNPDAPIFEEPGYDDFFPMPTEDMTEEELMEMEQKLKLMEAAGEIIIDREVETDSSDSSESSSPSEEAAE